MPDRIRVVHVSDIAFVGSTLVRSLPAAGVEARLIRPARPGASIPYPWKAAALPLRAAGLVSTAIQVRRSVADLTHVHFARLGIVGPLCGRPYVLHCHGSDVRGVSPASFWGRVVGPYLRGARLVYYSTPDLEPWVRAFRSDAVFLPNPIEIPDSGAGPAEPRTDVLVGVRLDPIKGSDEIARIVQALVRRRPATTISIVNLGRRVSRVQEAAGPAARLVPPVSHAAMPALFRRHRLAIGQQQVGALGNYELEAMVSSTPVAAAFRFPSAYDAPPPVIDGHGADSIAEHLSALLDDRAARLDLAAASRQWIQEHHEAAAIATRVASDYGRLLGG